MRKFALPTILAAIVAIIGLFGISANNTAEAGGGNSVTLRLPQNTAQIGDDIRVPITVIGNEIVGIQAVFKYDKERLTPVGTPSLGTCDLPSVLKNHVDAEQGVVNIALGARLGSHDPTIVSHCELATMTFKVIKSGTAALKFVLPPLHPSTGAVDNNGYVPIITVDGQVTISSGEPTYIVRVDWNTYVSGVMWGVVHSKDVSTTAARGTWFKDGSYAGKTFQLDTSPLTEVFPVASEQTPWAFATSVGYLELITIWDATVCPKGPEVFATPTGVTMYAPAGISAGWQLKDASGATLQLNQHQVGRNLQLAVFTADNRLCALAGYEHK